MSTHYFHTIDEAYQIFVRVEKNLVEDNVNAQGRGGQGRDHMGFGRSQTHTKNDDEVSSSNQSYRGGNNIGRGRGFGRGRGGKVCSYMFQVWETRAQDGRMMSKNQNDGRRNDVRHTWHR
jgi:hypothetical protein